MVQLELDIRFPTDRSDEETVFYRSRILREFKQGQRSNSKNFQTFSFEEAILKFSAKTNLYFKELSDNSGDDIDQWVARALGKALPYFAGKKGNFRSLGHFWKTYYEDIIYHLAVDRHRLIVGRQHETILPFPSKEVREQRRIGFQPPLLREARVNLAGHDLSKQFLADLRNPRGVLFGKEIIGLNPDYVVGLDKHRKRALILKSLNPRLSSKEIAKILEDEGFGTFADSAVRVWFKRAKDHQSTGLLTTQAV